MDNLRSSARSQSLISRIDPLSLGGIESIKQIGTVIAQQFLTDVVAAIGLAESEKAIGRTHGVHDIPVDWQGIRQVPRAL